MTEFNYLTEEERKLIEDKFRIPVDSTYPTKYWIVCIDSESFMPTEQELLQIQSYCAFKIITTYTASYQEEIFDKPLPVCGGHNTVVFRNGLRSQGFRTERSPGQWFYRKRLWRDGVVYVPDVLSSEYKPHTLVEVIDRNEIHSSLIRPQNWDEWKKDHSDIFPV